MLWTLVPPHPQCGARADSHLLPSVCRSDEGWWEEALALRLPPGDWELTWDQPWSQSLTQGGWKVKPIKFPQEGPEASAQGDLPPLERLYATQSDQQASLQGVMCQVVLWWELWQGQAGGGRGKSWGGSLLLLYPTAGFLGQRGNPRNQ